MCTIVDKCSKMKDQNVTKDEMESRDNLRKDDFIMILPGHCGDEQGRI